MAREGKSDSFVHARRHAKPDRIGPTILLREGNTGSKSLQFLVCESIQQRLFRHEGTIPKKCVLRRLAKAAEVCYPIATNIKTARVSPFPRLVCFDPCGFNEEALLAIPHGQPVCNS